MLDQMVNGGVAWRRHDASGGLTPPARAAMIASVPAIELRGVSRTWLAGAPGCTASLRALREIDLIVQAGEVVALAGRPGAGKTTLLLCAAGVVRPDEGRVGGSAAGRTTYVGPGGDDWVRRTLVAVEQGARAIALDVLDPPMLASPRAVAAVAGSLGSRGIAVLVAAREPGLLPAFATRLVVLAAGRVVGRIRPLALLRDRPPR